MIIPKTVFCLKFQLKRLFRTATLKLYEKINKYPSYLTIFINSFFQCSRDQSKHVQQQQ